MLLDLTTVRALTFKEYDDKYNWNQVGIIKFVGDESVSDRRNKVLNALLEVGFEHDDLMDFIADHLDVIDVSQFGIKILKK